MKELTLPANIDQLDTVLEFVEGILDTTDCPIDVRMHIQIAVEEIFVNIAHYAYTPSEGEATIRCSVSHEPPAVTIQFRDHGVPYNPLLREDPDITLTAEQRSIGGLGIFMVKKSMDEVQYQYADGQNIFTIVKYLESKEA